MLDLSPASLELSEDTEIAFFYNIDDILLEVHSGQRRAASALDQNPPLKDSDQMPLRLCVLCER